MGKIPTPTKYLFHLLSLKCTDIQNVVTSPVPRIWYGVAPFGVSNSIAWLLDSRAKVLP